VATRRTARDDRTRYPSVWSMDVRHVSPMFKHNRAIPMVKSLRSRSEVMTGPTGVMTGLTLTQGPVEAIFT
jgi:hypothetical protein